MSCLMPVRTLWGYFFGRRTLRAEAQMREQVLTPANALTFARAIGSVAILVIAIVRASDDLLLIGLAFSMVLDFVDGQIARGLKRETILGAQLDGAADRITAALVAAGVVSINGGAELIVAATLVWIQFGVVDQFLTSQFLRFGLWSPDHFYELGKPWGEEIWRRNWSALAKLASNLPIVLLAFRIWWAAALVSVILIVLRVPGYMGIRALARDRLETEAESSTPRDPRRTRGHSPGRDRHRAQRAR